MRKLNICLFALGALTIASNVQADPIKDPLPWVGPQILSVINKHNVWTPTDFAIASGENPTKSVSNLRIAKDVLRKGGVMLPGNRIRPNDMSTLTLSNILGTILLWSK